VALLATALVPAPALAGNEAGAFVGGLIVGGALGRAAQIYNPPVYVTPVPRVYVQPAPAYVVPQGGVYVQTGYGGRFLSAPAMVNAALSQLQHPDRHLCEQQRHHPVLQFALQLIDVSTNAETGAMMPPFFFVAIVADGQFSRLESASMFFFTASRLNEPGVWLGGNSTSVFRNSVAMAVVPKMMNGLSSSQS